MAKTEIEKPDLQTEVLASMASAIKLLAENQPAKVIGADSPEYQDRLRAEGFFDVFPTPVYQNGRECEPRGLSQETRERASALKTGKYIGGFVTVERTDKLVHIKYKSQTIEDRMRYASKWRDFSDLIDKIWAEMHATAAA